MSTKQKIVHGRRPSNINFETFISSFEVCWVSYLGGGGGGLEYKIKKVGVLGVSISDFGLA